ncbi:TnsA endonuclease C-terminal domain-containing protein, partial [Acinetobacter baumannii]|uniref:TnsA endonuclease C-terminal domain-containing protein n=1 Tax=Acinetobacter baumannii TaxID=470 RepID=UPI001C066DDC
QYWENINFLKKFRLSHVGAVDQQLLLDTLQELGQSTINQLTDHIFKDKTNVLKGIQQVWALVSKRMIACELYCPLTAETVICVNQNDAFARNI